MLQPVLFLVIYHTFPWSVADKMVFIGRVCLCAWCKGTCTLRAGMFSWYLCCINNCYPCVWWIWVYCAVIGGSTLLLTHINWIFFMHCQYATWLLSPGDSTINHGEVINIVVFHWGFWSSFLLLSAEFVAYAHLAERGKIFKNLNEMQGTDLTNFPALA